MATARLIASRYTRSGVQTATAMHRLWGHGTYAASLSSKTFARVSAAIAADKSSPLFRTAFGKTGRLTERRMHRTDALRMIWRRARGAGIETGLGCHCFRATGITVYLTNGGLLEHAQQMAAHESARTTKVYDRRNDKVTLDGGERIW